MAWRVGPKIDLTGVVLNLDAANPTSYNGIGSVWLDLSGFGNHFSLQNNPTWTGKSINFSAVSSQYALCSNSTCGNFGKGNFTIEHVSSFGTTGTNSTIIGKRNSVTSLGSVPQPGFVHRIGANAFWVQDNLSNGTINVTGVYNVPTGMISNNIYHVVQTINNNGTNTMVGKLYVNGILLNTSTYIWGNFNGNGSVDNANNIFLFRAHGEGTYLDGSMYLVRLYSRELSEIEAINNYQIYRQYYGF